MDSNRPLGRRFSSGVEPPRGSGTEQLIYTRGSAIVPIVRLWARSRQKGSRDRALCARSVRAILLAGLLAMGLAASVTAASALAAPPSWSAPTLIDSAPPEPIMDSVSCVSATCVAVDHFGNILASSDTTAASPTWSVSDVDGSGELLGISCTAGPLCVAVDGAGDVVVSTDPTGGTSDWKVSHIDGSRALLGVSCVSGPLCVAVDDAGDILTSTNPTIGDAWTVTHVSEGAIHAVSCATASLCVGAENNGGVLVSTEPTGGERAWTPAHIDGERSIYSVSCASTSLCVAVDLAGNVLTSSEPAGGASKWTATEIDEHALGAISCSSSSRCVAVDSAGDVVTSTEPAGGKSAWVATHIDTGEYLLAVSCVSSLCVAVNGYGYVFTAIDPRSGSAGWTAIHIDSNNPASILSVFCASVTLCLAVDNAKDVLSSTEPINPGAWVTTGPHERGGEILHAVACASASVCLAAGEYGLATSDPTGESPSIWTSRFERAFPEISDPEVEYLGPLDSISCGSPSLCVANLDSYNDFDALATSTDPASSMWQKVIGEGRMTGDGNHRSPPNQHDDPILGVSCASESLCVAVDAAGNAITSTNPTSSQSIWSIAPVETQPIWGISCPSSSLCVAIDHAGDVLTTTDPATIAPTWAVTDVDGISHLTGISCASESLCVAVDAVGNILFSSDPTGSGGTWNVVPVDSDHGFTGISCVTAGLCVAVDDAGYGVIGTFAPQSRGGQNGGGSGGEQSGGSAGTSTTTGSSPPPAVIASGVLRILSAKVGSRDQIVLTLKAPGDGSIDALATVAIREGAVGSRRSRCKTKCVHKIAYGESSAPTPGANTITITIKPTRGALAALKSRRTLRVPVAVTFDPRAGTSSTASDAVTVHYRLAGHAHKKR